MAVKEMETRIRVEGMTCRSCEHSVEACLLALNLKSTASFRSGSVTVKHNESVPLRRMTEAIEFAGFAANIAENQHAGEHAHIRNRSKSPSRIPKAENNLIASDSETISPFYSPKLAPASLVTLQVSIQFMTCGSCVKTISSTLENTAGVLKAVIDLKTETGWVTCSHDTVENSENVVISVIEGCGFEAQIIGKSIIDSTKLRGIFECLHQPSLNLRTRFQAL